MSKAGLYVEYSDRRLFLFYVVKNNEKDQWLIDEAKDVERNARKRVIRLLTSTFDS